MCVYVCMNTYVYIGTHIGGFLRKSLWTLFLGQLKATDEEACFVGRDPAVHISSIWNANEASSI